MEWQTRIGYHSWCSYRDSQCVIVVVVPTTLSAQLMRGHSAHEHLRNIGNIIYFTQVHCDQPLSSFYTTAKAEILRQTEFSVL